MKKEAIFKHIDASDEGYSFVQTDRDEICFYPGGAIINDEEFTWKELYDKAEKLFYNATGIPLGLAIATSLPPYAKK